MPLKARSHGLNGDWRECTMLVDFMLLPHLSTLTFRSFYGGSWRRETYRGDFGRQTGREEYLFNGVRGDFGRQTGGESEYLFNGLRGDFGRQTGGEKECLFSSVRDDFGRQTGGDKECLFSGVRDDFGRQTGGEECLFSGVTKYSRVWRRDEKARLGV